MEKVTLQQLTVQHIVNRHKPVLGAPNQPVGHGLPGNLNPSVGQLSEAMNLSEIAVKSVLDTSVECGLVDAFGSGKNRTYILSSRAYNTKARKIGYVRQADIDEARYQELVVKMAKENEYIARGDVVQLLHIDNGKAYRLLKALVDQHLLEQVNRGRYAKYRYCGDR